MMTSEPLKKNFLTLQHTNQSDNLRTEPNIDTVHIEDQDAHHDVHVSLGWRSWLVVLLTTFAIMAQVFVVVAAGSVISFIIRDLGDPEISGWIIQGPLLMQSVLSPIIGRLSDVLDRKYLAAVPPAIAFIGAVVSAKASSMIILIIGGILIGTTLSTISIVQSIPSEVLPLKYRALANGFGFIGGAIGGIIGSLGAGAVTNVNAGGWRYIFWMQAALHGATSLGLFLFYWPPKRSQYPAMGAWECIWACDPIGSTLFISGATSTLLALDWAGSAYPWSDVHVASTLAIGLVLLCLFSLYEWKGRSDGLVAHVFFRQNANFALSVFAFAVEGWIFYSAVNSIVPQMIMNLGFQTDSWLISIRQLSYTLTTMAASIPITWYATHFRDLKSPLIFTFVVFCIVTVCYANIKPNWNSPQIGFSILAAIGQSGPLTLLVACVQFTAPHTLLSTATGLAFSARAIGGAFGSAVLDAIINGYIGTHYASAVSAAATEAGLPTSSISALLAAFSAGTIGNDSAASIQGADNAVWKAAISASRAEYAHAYRLAWCSIIPFVVLATISVIFMRGVRELMTEKVEATVEKTELEPNSKRIAC